MNCEIHIDKHHADYRFEEFDKDGEVRVTYGCEEGFDLIRPDDATFMVIVTKVVESDKK